MSENKSTTAVTKKEESEAIKVRKATVAKETPKPETTVAKEALKPEAIVVKETPKLEATVTKETPVAKDMPKPAAPVKELQSTPKPEAAKPLTMAYLNSELQAVKQIVQEHGQQIAQLQEALARKRKPVANGKVQIKDKQTGKVYPSKNNAYQTMLKAGELKELADKGIFGDNPAKNTFGWYALVREWPDRFQEIRSEQNEEVKPAQSEDQT